MAYSKVGIVNLALTRIGVKRISALSEDSVPAIAANGIWEYVFDEVLEAMDWAFAKTRVALAQNVTSPVSGYEYAYTLPADFLRLCRDKKNDPAVYPSGGFANAYVLDDTNLIIPRYGYVIETLPDGTECLFINYDNDDDDLFIKYIRRIADMAKLSGRFVSALAYKLAQTLAYQLTESTTKEKSMKKKYAEAIREAAALNESGDWIEDEIGSTSWEYAGR